VKQETSIIMKNAQKTEVDRKGRMECCRGNHTPKKKKLSIEIHRISLKDRRIGATSTGRGKRG